MEILQQRANSAVRLNCGPYLLPTISVYDQSIYDFIVMFMSFIILLQGHHTTLYSLCNVGVQVSEHQVQQATQSLYLAGKDCVQQSQNQHGKTSCLLAEME